MLRKSGLAVALLLTSWASTAAAQSPYAAANDSGDTAWVLFAALLVLLLALPGLAIAYCGSVRAKNALSPILQIAAAAAAVSLLWIALGYTLAFGTVTNGWIGGGNAWMLNDLGNFRPGLTIPESAFALFEVALAVFATALMIGAWVERARFGWVVAFCALWSVLIYAPAAHWIWGGGLIAAKLGALDFAGGIVIQTSAGVSALVVALLLGRRTDFPQASANTHAPWLSLIGGLLVWIGWLALNGGAAMAATDDASAAIINAHVAASAGALTFLLIERFVTRKTTATGFLKGALAGLAAISAAAGWVSPGAAILFGMVAALVSQGALYLVRNILHIDDSMDVFSIHGASGIVGAILLGVFLSPQLGGTGYAAHMTMLDQLGMQATGIAIVAMWSAVGSAILALGISLFIPMRVTEAQESEGLDASFHDRQIIPAEDR